MFIEPEPPNHLLAPLGARYVSLLAERRSLAGLRFL
jgi:hypothetical protein